MDISIETAYLNGGAKLMQTNATPRDIFKAAMEAAGMPIKRVTGIHFANQLFEITAGAHKGKIVRLKTNAKAHVVMTKATGANAEASIPALEDVDFLGSISGTEAGEFDCYLIPAERALEDFQESHRAWIRSGSKGDSDVRCLYFRHDTRNRPWYGYARKYAAFKLDGGTAATSAVPSAAPPSHNGAQGVIEQARQMIAAAYDVTPERVRISVDF
jgi:hypothetical protein